jgi:7,8-dihydropterin-6-yl-methyl-4-(beta-D-ribofuranosyl)aminobenzene 5'-phosphate synthase
MEPMRTTLVVTAPLLLIGLLVLSVLSSGCAPQAATPTPAPTSSPSTAATPRPPTDTPPPSSTPRATTTPQPTADPTATEEVQTVTFTIVYDNNAYDDRLRTQWGFACWVETADTTILFDTGGDGATLLSNMKTLGLDPEALDVVVLSHAHGDHTGGLGALLSTGARPTVYAPASFARGFKRDVRNLTELVEVTEPAQIAPGIYTTGEVGSRIVEQALAVETTDGLVVVTGCAHPGVDQMVERAGESIDDDIALVMGGFHLGGASRGRVEGIIDDFRAMGVERVAPCHCTGDAARSLFEEAFGDDYVPAGAGWSFTVER